MGRQATRTFLLFAVFIVATSVVRLLGKGQAEQTPLRFEVAAIKLNTSGEVDGRLALQPGGYFRAVNFDLWNLIAFAYRTKPRNLTSDQVIGAPDWTTTARYDINAKVDKDLFDRTATDPFRAPKLVQSLLEDRFDLKAHRERRNLQVYALTRLAKDASLGPRMQPSSIDCNKERQKCAIDGMPGYLKTGATTLDTLAAVLSNRVQRLVVDRTGLVGMFAVELEWAADDPASDKPSIFTAVQEQLALKLESTHEQIDVVVIDHVERPTTD